MAKRFWFLPVAVIVIGLRFADHFSKYGTSHFSVNGLLFGIFAALLFNFSIVWFANRNLSKQQTKPIDMGKYRQIQLIILGISLLMFPGVAAFTVI